MQPASAHGLKNPPKMYFDFFKIVKFTFKKNRFFFSKSGPRAGCILRWASGSGREHFCALTREIHCEITRESKTHGFREVLEGIWSFSAKLFRVSGNRLRSSRPLASGDETLARKTYRNPHFFGTPRCISAGAVRISPPPDLAIDVISILSERRAASGDHF